jgi:hypothetical protein
MSYARLLFLEKSSQFHGATRAQRLGGIIVNHFSLKNAWTSGASGRILRDFVKFRRSAISSWYNY